MRALGGLPLPALLQQAVEVVRDMLDIELVKIVELLPDGTEARVVAGTGWKEGVVGTATITVGRDSQAGYALLSRTPVVVQALDAETCFTPPPLFREHGVQSGMSVILYGPEGSAYGVLGAHTRRSREFTSEEAAFLQGVANVLSAAMERRHAEDELRRAHAEAEAYALQLRSQAAELEAQTEEAQALSEELELVNERLLREAEAAEAARRRATAILDGLSDLVVACDRSWRWLYFNPAAREAALALGVDPDAAIGRVVVEQVPQLRGTRLEREARRAVASGELVELEEYFAPLDRWFEVRVDPSGDGTVTIYARDVTARRRGREVERAAAERARRLLRLASGLSGATTLDQVADVIFREGIAALGADAGSLALLRTAPDGTPEFEVVRTQGYPAPLAAAFHRFPLRPGRPLSDAALAREPRVVGSLAEMHRDYPGAARDLAESGFEAYVAVPVIAGERVLGAVSASFRVPVAMDEATRTFLATLGEQCGLALERARAFNAEHRARSASAFLAEASRLLATSLDYESTLRAVAQTVVPQLADCCVLDLVREPAAGSWPPVVERLAVVHRDPRKSALVAELVSRYPWDWSAPGGMAGVLRDRTPMFAPRFTEEMLAAAARDERQRRMLHELAITSLIVVPLVARDLTLGALTLFTSDSGRHFDEDDLALAQDLGARVAAAVDNARLFREAEAARQAAEEANRGKSQFLAMMSHELRTPLNAIAGHVQLLELGIHGPVTEAQRETLARVDRAQRHLLGLINDVLNYARIESGRVEYDVRPVRVADVLRDVRPMVEPLLAAKGLAYDVRLDDADARVLVDPDKLAQILLNLLSNAIKFTPAERDGMQGRVVVALRSAPAEADGHDAVLLEVIDNGIGIPHTKLDAIFEPFVQVRSDFAREMGGTGLGLAISRDLARAMGGDIRVCSTEGTGTTFTVSLRAATG